MTQSKHPDRPLATSDEDAGITAITPATSTHRLLIAMGFLVIVLLIYLIYINVPEPQDPNPFGAPNATPEATPMPGTEARAVPVSREPLRIAVRGGSDVELGTARWPERRLDRVVSLRRAAGRDDPILFGVWTVRPLEPHTGRDVEALSIDEGRSSCLQGRVKADPTTSDLCEIVVSYVPHTDEAHSVSAQIGLEYQPFIAAGETYPTIHDAPGEWDTQTLTLTVHASADPTPAPATLSATPHPIRFVEASPADPTLVSLELSATERPLRVLSAHFEPQRPDMEIVAQELSACLRDYVPGSQTGRDWCRMRLSWTPQRHAQTLRDTELLLVWEEIVPQAERAQGTVQSRQLLRIPVTGHAASAAPQRTARQASLEVAPSPLVLRRGEPAAIEIRVLHAPATVLDIRPDPATSARGLELKGTRECQREYQPGARTTADWCRLAASPPGEGEAWQGSIEITWQTPAPGPGQAPDRHLSTVEVDFEPPRRAVQRPRIEPRPARVVFDPDPGPGTYSATVLVHNASTTDVQVERVLVTASRAVAAQGLHANANDCTPTPATEEQPPTPRPTAPGNACLVTLTWERAANAAPLRAELRILWNAGPGARAHTSVAVRERSTDTEAAHARLSTRADGLTVLHIDTPEGKRLSTVLDAETLARLAPYRARSAAHPARDASALALDRLALEMTDEGPVLRVRGSDGRDHRLALDLSPEEAQRIAGATASATVARGEDGRYRLRLHDRDGNTHAELALDEETALALQGPAPKALDLRDVAFDTEGFVYRDPRTGRTLRVPLPPEVAATLLERPPSALHIARDPATASAVLLVADEAGNVERIALDKQPGGALFALANPPTRQVHPDTLRQSGIRILDPDFAQALTDPATARTLRLGRDARSGGAWLQIAGAHGRTLYQVIDEDQATLLEDLIGILQEQDSDETALRLPDASVHRDGDGNLFLQWTDSDGERQRIALSAAPSGAGRAPNDEHAPPSPENDSRRTGHQAPGPAQAQRRTTPALDTGLRHARADLLARQTTAILSEGVGVLTSARPQAEPSTLALRAPAPQLIDTNYRDIGLDPLSGVSSRPVDLRSTIAWGTPMTATIQGTIDARYPSIVVAVLEHDVLSAHGSNIVLHRGDKIYGRSLPFAHGRGNERRTGNQPSRMLASGARVSMAWDLMERADGTRWRVTEYMTTSDLQGRSGVPAIVDPYELERYVQMVATVGTQAAVLLLRPDQTIVRGAGTGAGISANPAQNAPEVSETTISGEHLAVDRLLKGMEEVSNALIQNQPIMPSVTIPSGQRILLRPSNDMWLKPAAGPALASLTPPRDPEGITDGAQNAAAPPEPAATSIPLTAHEQAMLAAQDHAGHPPAGVGQSIAPLPEPPSRVRPRSTSPQGASAAFTPLPPAAGVTWQPGPNVAEPDAPGLMRHPYGAGAPARTHQEGLAPALSQAPAETEHSVRGREGVNRLLAPNTNPPVQPMWLAPANP